MLSQTQRLGTESPGKLLFKLSLPAIAAQIVNLAYNLVDRMYIGNIPGTGQAALTGMGVCLPLIMLITAGSNLVSMGGAPRASIFFGKGDQQNARHTMANCLTMLLVFSAVLTTVFLLFPRPLLLLFGASENTIDYAVDYMSIYATGTVFVQLTLGMNAFITAQGFARTGMFTVIIGAALNIALDPIFIFVFDLGVRGAAIATVISQAVSAAWVLMFLSGKKATLKLCPSLMRLKASIILPCLALGLSPFIMGATESVLNVCFNTSLLKYGGDIAVCTMTVLSSVMQLAMLPLHGLTQGSQPIISFNYGAGDSGRCKRTFRLLLICCVTYSAVFGITAICVPEMFIKLFNSDPDLIAFAVPAMRIYMAACAIFGMQIACQQTFIALGNAKSSLFLALLRKVFLLIPLIYILPALLENKTNAVFLAEPTADIIAVTTTVILFSVQFSKAMKELDKKNTIQGV